MLNWIGNDQLMRMRETSRGVDKKLHGNTNLSQIPFSGLNIGIPRTDDAALVCKHILLAYEKGLNGSIAIFPNIAFRLKAGVNRNPEDKYYWLYQLSCRVTANRLNPTYLNLDAPINKQYWDQGVVSAIMG